MTLPRIITITSIIVSVVCLIAAVGTADDTNIPVQIVLAPPVNLPPAQSQRQWLQANITPSQVTNLWAVVMPQLVIPSIASSNHIQSLNFVLLPDGSARVTTMWQADKP